MHDGALVQAAADLARQYDAGTKPAPGVVSLLQAIAKTREQTQRQELARQAAEHAGAITDAALSFLRITIFLLAA